MIAGFGLREDAVDFAAVGVVGLGAGGIHEELADHVGREDPGLAQEERLKVADVFEGLAAGEPAGGIDGLVEADVWVPAGGEMKGDLRVAAVERAVAVAEAADDIVVLQCEAGRVDLRVTTGAARVGAMLFQLLADRLRAACVGINRGHACRWWRDVVAEDALIDPDTARDRGCAGAVGGDFQHGGLREEGAARAVRWQRDAAEVASCDAGNAVVISKALIEHRKIRFHEMRDAEVFCDQLAQVGARFRDHAVLQMLAGFRVKLGVGLRGVDLSQVEPLVGKVGD